MALAYRLVPRLESIPVTPGREGKELINAGESSLDIKTWVKSLPYPSGVMNWLIKSPIQATNPHPRRSRQI
jgi:hypothetical protein